MNHTITKSINLNVSINLKPNTIQRRQHPTHIQLNMTLLRPFNPPTFRSMHPQGSPTLSTTPIPINPPSPIKPPLTTPINHPFHPSEAVSTITPDRQPLRYPPHHHCEPLPALAYLLLEGFEPQCHLPTKAEKHLNQPPPQTAAPPALRSNASELSAARRPAMSNPNPTLQKMIE